mmetsp:Transcript_26883/g.56616  ORF Transcript_26883/g.56616 Transcript_26883/m.56616 type:complete len:422 (-) Transcript_26883:288-1553(-)
MPLLRPSHIRHLLPNLNTNPRKPHIPLLSHPRLHEIRRRTQIIRHHAHRIKMRRRLGLIPHQPEHIHRLLIERRNGNFARLDVPSVPPPRRRHPNGAPPALEHLQHLVHGPHVLRRLGRFGLGIGVDVLLGVDAQQIPPHGEGDCQGIGGDLVSRHVRDVRGEITVFRSHRFEETGHDLGIGFRLMICEEDDVFSVSNLFQRLGHVVLAENEAPSQIHRRTEEVAARGVEVRLGVRAQHGEEGFVGVAFVGAVGVAAEGLVGGAGEGEFGGAEAVFHAELEGGGHFLRGLAGGDGGAVGVGGAGGGGDGEGGEVLVHEVDEGAFEGGGGEGGLQGGDGLVAGRLEVGREGGGGGFVFGGGEDGGGRREGSGVGRASRGDGRGGGGEGVDGAAGTEKDRRRDYRAGEFHCGGVIALLLVCRC